MKQQQEQSGSRIPFFDKDVTDMIKGVALIMMFIHHFFTFPDWWGTGIDYPFFRAHEEVLRTAFQMCVPVFCFLTGYFYAFRKAMGHSLRYVLKKITDVEVTYLCYFLLLGLTAALGCHYSYDLKGILKEALALETPTMVFCWYVAFYAAFMLLFPLVTRLLEGGIHWACFFALILIPFVLGNLPRVGLLATLSGVLDNLCRWFPVVLAGYITSRYGLFEKMESLEKKSPRSVRIVLWVLLALAAAAGRYAEPVLKIGFSKLPQTFLISMDVLYAPLFIYSLANLSKILRWPVIRLPLKEIGKYSLPMWFLSCGFFGNCRSLLQPVLYRPGHPVLVLVWGLLLCYGLAKLMDVGLKPLLRLKNKIFIN